MKIENGSAEASVTESIWRDTAGWVPHNVLPSHFFRVDGEAQILPISSQFKLMK